MELAFSAISTVITRKRTAFFTVVIEHLTVEWSVGLKRDFYPKFLPATNRYSITSIVASIRMVSRIRQLELLFGVS